MVPNACNFPSSNGSPDKKYGARILQLNSVKDFSTHNIDLVNSKHFRPAPYNPNLHKFAAPALHIVLDKCSNGELYNTTIRGGNEGGLDGIDIWCSNIHVHDVEGSNSNECMVSR